MRNEKNRGVFVREIAFEEADEIYELREALKKSSGRGARAGHRARRHRALRAMLDAMRSAA